MEVRLMDHFAGITTQRGAHRRYRALGLKWHPDRCADERAGSIMAAINHDYKECLKRIEAAGDSLSTEAIRAEVAPVPIKRTRPKRPKPREKPDADIDRIIDKGGDLLKDVCVTAIEKGIRWVKEKM